MDKRSSEQQFCKSNVITFVVCRNSRTVALAELGLTAGWLAGWLAVDKFQIFKIDFIVDQIFKLFAAFNTVTALLEQYECI